MRAPRIPLPVAALVREAERAGWAVTARYESPAWLVEMRPPQPGPGRVSRVCVTAELRPRPAWQITAAVERIDWGGRVAARRLTGKQVRSALRGTG